MAHPIKRLHHDLHRLHVARRDRKHDAKELRKDERALKTDRRHLEHHRDVFESTHKELKKDRTALGNLHERAQAKLEPLQAQRDQLQAAYDASIDPLTGMGDPQLQLQLGAVDQQLANVHARFDPKIDAKKQEVDHGAAVIDRKRDQIHEDRRDIKQDRREVKHDKKALAHAKKHVKNARHTALEHLRPAEYKMGLKQTNKVRKDLGLKPVDHVIRPGVPNVVGGQIGKWIAKAQTILKHHGIPLSKMNAHDLAIIIRHESGGNPKAVNNWDSNAAAGTPSKGLMQTIGPTFNAYKLPGHGHILNPIDNIIAGVRYAIARYGSVSNVPGVRAVHAGGAYVGY